MESPTSEERTLSLRDSVHGFSGRPIYSILDPGSSPRHDTSHAGSHVDNAEAEGTQAQSPLPGAASINRIGSASVHNSIRGSIDNCRQHTWSISTNSAEQPRSSLDPTIRPPSMRGENSEKPWIGTFKDFENPDDEVPPLPDQTVLREHAANGLAENGHSMISSNDRDEEKGEASDSSDDSSNSKGKGEDNSKKDPNLIDWDGPDDPTNPQNFPASRKWLYTALYGTLTFAVTFASSIFSTAIMPTSREYGVSEEVMLLGTSLFVLGFAWGPPIWGPFSELYGRKSPLYFGYIAFGIFNVPVAVAQNLQTIFVCRFFGGLFASAPLAVVGGALADLWDPVRRGYAMCVFSGATFIGPAMGPIVGSFTVENESLGWRWTAWLTAIISLSIGITTFFIIPETFAPRLLHNKAAAIRFETKNWAIHSLQDEQKTTLGDVAVRYIKRPFLMLFQEPILDLITLYISLIYGILYLFFEAFPIAFEETRGYKPGVGSLPFISLLCGVCVGALVIVLITKYRFAPRLKRAGRLIPEERLVPMFIGGAMLPAGLFWFAWTADPHISVWPQIVSIAVAGAGVMMIFLQGLNYLIDVYLMNANSAIAANTFVRSWIGAGFVMFATGMYHDLGVPWATSLLAFLSIALYPAPIVFYLYGEKIRSWSKFSPTM